MWCFVHCNTVSIARAKLPSLVPNLETLSLCSVSEVINTPVVPHKFLCLKCLSILLDVGEGAFSPVYDYFSLVSYLDACPILETFELVVSQTRMKHDSVLGDPLNFRQVPEYRNDNIKSVKIIGFCSAKSMVELTCHILESSTSLECLTLDTINESHNIDRHIHKIGQCSHIGKHMIREAHKALLAIKRHIVGKVPSTVKLNVLEPCSQCHVLGA